MKNGLTAFSGKNWMNPIAENESFCINLSVECNSLHLFCTVSLVKIQTHLLFCQEARIFSLLENIGTFE